VNLTGILESIDLTCEKIAQDFQINLSTETSTLAITLSLHMAKNLFNIPNSTTEELLNNLPMHAKVTLDSTDRVVSAE